MKLKKISIITPCYNEELTVNECHAVVQNLFSKELPEYDYEHIFCDNASTDETENQLRILANKDKHVKVILNARNFGPFHSMFNGLRYATGDAILVMLAADLQDPPELIVDFVRKWEAGYKVVYGVRTNRKENMLLRSARKVFYRVVNKFANFDIPVDAGEFQLIDKVVLKAVLAHDDYYPYIRGMIAGVGFNSVGVSYEFRGREMGTSTNNLYRLVDQAINGIISFSNVPMRLSVFAGLIISTISFLFAGVTFISQLITHGSIAAPGVSTVIVAIFFFGGVQLFSIGILGEYISAIHSQVRKKPLVVEKERLNVD